MVTPGIGSGIGNTFAKLPALIGPFCFKPSLLLAREELGDDVGLLIVDAVAATGLHQKRHIGK
jgi:hypothetical protein